MFTSPTEVNVNVNLFDVFGPQVSTLQAGRDQRPGSWYLRFKDEMDWNRLKWHDTTGHCCLELRGFPHVVQETVYALLTLSRFLPSSEIPSRTYVLAPQVEDTKGFPAKWASWAHLSWFWWIQLRYKISSIFVDFGIEGTPLVWPSQCGRSPQWSRSNREFGVKMPTQNQAPTRTGHEMIWNDMKCIIHLQYGSVWFLWAIMM